MCGRYVSPDEAALDRAWSRVRGQNPFPTTYNAAPSMALPVVRIHEGRTEILPMRWGLIPAWWARQEPPRSTINARVEEAATKPMWRSAVKRTRCLVPSLGWFEWKPRPDRRGKQPYFIHRPGMALFHFAGLWSSWTPKEGQPLHTFAILTTAAAPGIAAIHDRMPIVLPPKAHEDWLDPDAREGAALTAFASQAAEPEFDAYPVSTYVNVPRNQGERCIERLDIITTVS
jgi:putative SOS response-associated peptidase YedK